MASLQCPSCGNRHPIDIIPDTETFACQQCRRLLKVPDALRHRRADALVTSRPGTNGEQGNGGRVSALSPTGHPEHGSSPSSAGAGASPFALSDGRPSVGSRVAAPEARPAELRPADVRPADAFARAFPDASAPPEILAPPPSPEASVILGTPGRPPDGDGVVALAPGSAVVIPPRDGVVVVPDVDRDRAAVAPPRRDVRVHWLLRFLVWVVALVIAAVAVIVPYRRVGLIDFDGALKVIGGRGFEQWELPLIIVPPWAMGTALVAHFSIEGLARLRRRSLERKAAAAAAQPAPG
jgi:hypothetical protein